jgi:hypothetical protein
MPAHVTPRTGTTRAMHLALQKLRGVHCAAAASPGQQHRLRCPLAHAEFSVDS